MSAIIRNITMETSNANNAQHGVVNTSAPITKPVYAPSTATTTPKEIPVVSQPATVAAFVEPSSATGANTAGRWTSNPSHVPHPITTTTDTDIGKPQRFVTALPLRSSDSQNAALVAELLRAKRTKGEKAAAAAEEKNRTLTEHQISTEKENLTLPTGTTTTTMNRPNGPVYRASGANRNVGFSTYNPVPASHAVSPSEVPMSNAGPPPMRPLYVDTSAGNSSAAPTHMGSQVVSVGRLTIPKVVMGEDGQYHHNSQPRSMIGLNSHPSDNRSRQVPYTTQSMECNTNEGMVGDTQPSCTGENSRACGASNLNEERKYAAGEKSDEAYRGDTFDESKQHHHILASNPTGVYEGAWKGGAQNGPYHHHQQQASYGYHDTGAPAPPVMEDTFRTWSAGSHHAPAISVSVGSRGSSAIPMQKVYLPQQPYYCPNRAPNNQNSGNGGYNCGLMDDTHNMHIKERSALTLPSAQRAIDGVNTDAHHVTSIVPEEALQHRTTAATHVDEAQATLLSPSKKLQTPQKTKASPKNNHRTRSRFNFAPVGKLFESPGGVSVTCSPAKGAMSPIPTKFINFDTPLSNAKQNSNASDKKSSASPITAPRISLGNNTNSSNIIPLLASAMEARKGAQGPNRSSGGSSTAASATNTSNNNNRRKSRHGEPVHATSGGKSAPRTDYVPPVAEEQERNIVSFFASSPEILKSATLKSRNMKKAAGTSSPIAPAVEEHSLHSPIINPKASHQYHQGIHRTDVDKRHYVEVERHHSRRLHVLAFNDSFLCEGAYVIFEGDRGEDIGRVVSFSAIPPAALIANPKLMPTAMIIRIANDDEVALWKGPQLDEANEAVETCAKCVKRHLLPLTIVSAAFQFDRKKLTVFYKTSANRVDFRKMVMDLHNSFHCRIWMERLDNGGTQE